MPVEPRRDRSFRYALKFFVAHVPLLFFAGRRQHELGIAFEQLRRPDSTLSRWVMAQYRADVADGTKGEEPKAGPNDHTPPAGRTDDPSTRTERTEQEPAPSPAAAVVHDEVPVDDRVDVTNDDRAPRAADFEPAKGERAEPTHGDSESRGPHVDAPSPEARNTARGPPHDAPLTQRED